MSDIIDRLLNIKRGEMVIYHTGFLAADCDEDNICDKSNHARHLRTLTKTLFYRGKITMTQKRHAHGNKNGQFEYDYYAIGI